MTGEKKVTKEGINNIFNASKKLPREAAAKKYHSLSPQARKEADKWINRAFYLETSIKPGTKLDAKNPEHSAYIEKWLNHRDQVMGWPRNWEKPNKNLDTRIFRDKSPPTSPETLRKSQGIFEQRMTPKQFKKHVQDRILEAKTYNPSELRKTQRGIAHSLTSKLLENKTWLKNTVTTREGRDALRILEGQYLMSTDELRFFTREEYRMYKKLTKILRPYDAEIIEENRINRIVNRESFKQIFPKLSEGIKAKLESQGYQVEKIYHRPFLYHVYEIRAETVKKVEVKLNTIGYRGDPYVKNVRTERKNISVGGINLENGKFIGARFFNKHGTAETDWDTQLAIGEVAVLAGAGIRAAFSGVRSILLKAGEKTTVKVGESLAGKQLRDTVQDLGETIRISRSTLNDTGDTLQDLGGTLRGVRTETSDTVQDLGPTLAGTKKADTLQDAGSTIPGGTPPRITGNYDDIRSWIDDDRVISGANGIGMDQEALADYFDHLSMQVVNFNKQAMFFGEGPELIRKTALAQIQKATSTLGVDRTKKLVAYGMDPMDISNHIDDLVSKGLTPQMIRENVSNEIKLMNHMRDHYLNGSQRMARAVMSVNGRSAEKAIKSEIQDNLMTQYKLDNPNYHEMPTKFLGNKWLEQSKEAETLARRVKEGVLGSASAGVIVYKRPDAIDKKGDRKPLKVKEKQPDRETTKKIREPRF
jgi:hypothetical protein